jgi:hypothetical protein
MTTQAFQSSPASQPAVASFGSNTSLLSVSRAVCLPGPPVAIWDQQRDASNVWFLGVDTPIRNRIGQSWISAE